MNDKEAIEMMSRCLGEIEALQHQRDFLSPRAEAYEVIREVVLMNPRRNAAASESITWTLKNKIKELQEKVNAELPKKL